MKKLTLSFLLSISILQGHWLVQTSDNSSNHAVPFFETLALFETQMDPGGWWGRSDNITRKLSQRTNSPLTSGDESQTGCSTGWSGFEGYCYKYFDDEKNWQDAREHCLSKQVSAFIIFFINQTFQSIRLTWLQYTRRRKITL